MNLEQIVKRISSPEPWQEGEKIPWNEAGFSRRMLAEHLSQQHDAASRRFSEIDRQVEWIHRELLNGQSSKVLDLGCGPGLYTSRFAKLGHICQGIDFSPASVDYARQQAENEHLACTYLQADIRTAEYGQDYDLVMLIFGELNVFRRADALAILGKARAVIKPSGQLLLEPHSFAAVKKMGQESCNWWSAEQGLFGETPHLVLTESLWHEAAQAATTRYYVIEAASGQVERFAESVQAYSDEDYCHLLMEAGFEGFQFYPQLAGQPGGAQTDLIAITARPVKSN